MPVPVISVAQMREWEAATWASGQSVPEVIRHVGRAIGRRIEALTPRRGLILVFAGQGHNGDDACAAVEGLTDREVRVFRVTDPELAITESADWLKRGPELIVDGLFGIGMNRSLDRSWMRLIQEINQSGGPILAVDVPSGLNADTGQPWGEAIRATHTVTLGAVKHGLLKSESWPFVGRLDVAPEIGLVRPPFSTEISWIDGADFPRFPPPRPWAGHKGTFGHLVILAGSVGYHGASVLAARGAQRAQPGLITLFTTEAVYHPVAEPLHSVMVKPWAAGAAFEMPANSTAVVVGPGLAGPDLPDAMPGSVRQLWRESTLPMIVDASALAWLPEGACPPEAIRVVTPHPGEASRMLGMSAHEIQAHRPEALRAISRRWGGCWVVLKGYQTLIGRVHGDVFVNGSGNPHLAQGGSGDLLAGYLGGLLAQPALRSEPGRTLCYGVWQHGAAADALQEMRRNWTVEDLSEVLGNIRKV